ncbi:hypothetical protein EJ05DRAFT_520608 [Pseudovirgaria hyperparasitica]|uniref:Uncharacterized protein n=1 Tax=Pseudovirgaria hyperparasitica TaxID=470096 RepID=A0A6A6VUZ8_9PEZI|nr:uncharacterized protein EJ05DRAFT_520608 [Pseudovirgaria hyperparasitica]KAF2754508.1 hypothetical protein EJ05DRAFT_520608 [Pseudovirgaria hyperparasitica]
MSIFQEDGPETPGSQTYIIPHTDHPQIYSLWDAHIVAYDVTEKLDIANKVLVPFTTYTYIQVEEKLVVTTDLREYSFAYIFPDTDSLFHGNRRLRLAGCTLVSRDTYANERPLRAVEWRFIKSFGTDTKTFTLGSRSMKIGTAISWYDAAFAAETRDLNSSLGLRLNPIHIYPGSRMKTVEAVLVPSQTRDATDPNKPLFTIPCAAYRYNATFRRLQIYFDQEDTTVTHNGQDININRPDPSLARYLDYEVAVPRVQEIVLAFEDGESTVTRRGRISDFGDEEGGYAALGGLPWTITVRRLIEAIAALKAAHKSRMEHN